MVGVIKVRCLPSQHKDGVLKVHKEHKVHKERKVLKVGVAQVLQVDNKDGVVKISNLNLFNLDNKHGEHKVLEHREPGNKVGEDKALKAQDNKHGAKEPGHKELDNKHGDRELEHKVQDSKLGVVKAPKVLKVIKVGAKAPKELVNNNGEVKEPEHKETKVSLNLASST